MWCRGARGMADQTCRLGSTRPGSSLTLGEYEGQFILTEESFHGSGLAGGWAAAMGAPALFHLVAEQVPALQPSGLIAVVALLLAFGTMGLAAGQRRSRS